MDNLFQLIAELLGDNSCVIVPGLGGFVPNQQPARVDGRSCRCYPPSVEVLFNAQLDHNDGLLVQAWADTNHTTMDEARQQVDAAVADFLRQLKSQKVFRISYFGTFRNTATGLTFACEPDCVVSPSSFGQEDFYFPKLSKQESEKNHTVWKQVLGVAGVGVASAAMLMLLARPIADGQRQWFRLPVVQGASFSPFGSSCPTSSPAPKERVVVKYVRVPVSAAAQPSEKPVFHLILKNFGSQAQADAFVKTMQPKLTDSLRVVHLGEVYAVACATTTRADVATRMLQNVQRNSPFKQSFILYK